MALHCCFQARMKFLFSFSRMNLFIKIHFNDALLSVAMVIETRVTCNNCFCLDSACNSEMKALSAAEEAETGNMTSWPFPPALIASSLFWYANISTSANRKKIILTWAVLVIWPLQMCSNRLYYTEPANQYQSSPINPHGKVTVSA